MVSDAMHALHAALGDDTARAGYWTALSRFLRFDIAKADFDQIALKALGPHVKLHNDVIRALLSEASSHAGGNSGSMNPSPHPFTAHRLPPTDNSHAAAVGNTRTFLSQPPGAGPGRVPNSDFAANQPHGLETQSSAGPKLMLKIGLGAGGKIEASAQRSDLNPQEEEQLNALHDRLREIVSAKGLTGVQPEAVSFIQRAVRVVSSRLLVAASHGTFADGEQLTGEDIREAIRQPSAVPTTWMAPPSQRPGFNQLGQLGAIGKYGA